MWASASCAALAVQLAAIVRVAAGSQEKVLRPLLGRFFSRQEAESGAWEWARSREQVRRSFLALCPSYAKDWLVLVQGA